MTRVRHILLSIIMLTICVFLPSSVFAAEVTVTSASALQEAINNAGYNDVINVSGTIDVNETIDIPYDKHLTIKGGTLKRQSGCTGCLVGFSGHKTSKYGNAEASQAYVTFDGVILDGNKSVVTSADYLMGTYFGEHITINNCKLQNNGGSAIGTPSWNNDSYLTITNTSITDNENHGISRYVVCTLSNCTISRNGGDGLVLMAEVPSRSFTVSNCQIKDNGSSGIYMQNWDGNNYIGNSVLLVNGGEISGNGEYGLYLKHTNGTLSGNVKISGNNCAIQDTSKSVTVIQDAEISNSTKKGLEVWGQLVLEGASNIKDPVILVGRKTVPANGTISVSAKLPAKQVITVKTEDFLEGWKSIYISNSSYAKASQFVCGDAGYTFKEGSDHWLTYEKGSAPSSSTPSTPDKKDAKTTTITPSATTVKPGKKVTIKSSSGATVTVAGKNTLAKNKNFVKIGKAAKAVKLSFTKKAKKGAYKFTVSCPASGNYKAVSKKVITIKVK